MLVHPILILGSANINDRSMLGSRDSELAVFVEDEERIPSIMGGEEYEAGPLTLALRKECFRSGDTLWSSKIPTVFTPVALEFYLKSNCNTWWQHLHLVPISLTRVSLLFSVLVGAASNPSLNIDDPISDDLFFLVWNSAAKMNATIYKKVSTDVLWWKLWMTTRLLCYVLQS